MIRPIEHEHSDETAATVDEEVRRIIDAVFERRIALLRERREALEQSARLLLARETLDEDDLKSLTQPEAAQQPI